MKYRINEKPKKPRRWWWLLLLFSAAVLYSLLVYSWWVEGNENFERQRIEQTETP